MRKLLSLILFIILGVSGHAQVTPSSGQPWVKIQTARVATTNPADLDDPEKGHTTIQYYDGWGRVMQTVHHAATPTGKDLINGANTLDALGRPDKSYLMFPSNQSNGQIVSILQVQTQAQAFYGDSKPYSQIVQYDNSPMSRVLKTFKPGAAFQTGSSLGTQQDYEIVDAGIIRRYVIVDDDNINGTGTYDAGKLIKTWTQDEDGNQVIEYHGAQSGRLLQRHQKAKGTSELLITAYVYDIYGRLRFVVPPKLYNATQNIHVPTHAEGLYSYHYDERSRLVNTRKPGAAAEYTIYNALGQVVMSHSSTGSEPSEWLWVKYDGHGRVVMSGKLTTTYTRAQLQTFFDDYAEPEQFEEPSTAGGNLLRYTNRSFPTQISIGESQVMIVNYYDQYDWVADLALNFQQYENPRYTNARGLPTGNKVRRLDTGAWMKTVWYYDDQNRIIQTQTENRFGSINQTDLTLDFEGNLHEERTIYRRPSQADLTISTLYSFDAGGRRIAAKHKINGTESPIAKYEYDELNRMVKKHLGVAEGREIIIENSPQPDGDRDIAFRYVELQPGTYTADAGTYLASIAPGPVQTVDYSYTLHGQLRGINLDENNNIPDNLGNDLFALKLDHHETGETYNGKLSKQTWVTPLSYGEGSGVGSGVQRSFTYHYDDFDRISQADYSGQGNEDYGMPGIGYDANGNLTAFNRKGLLSSNNWQSIDILSFNYQNNISNRLDYIVDYASQTVGFKDNGGFNTDYTYWPDGSLKSDANKGITLIEYNYLGLADKIHFGSSKRIELIYDAEGQKLAQKLVNGSNTHLTEYIGDLIYVDGQLQTIFHDEGRVRIEDGGLIRMEDRGLSGAEAPLSARARYQFFITDHLGNTRIIVERVNDTTALVQENHYGVWGEPLTGIGMDGAEASDRWNFLFQGKEYVDFEGLNLYDFHSRFYDPWTGRFWQIDGADQFASGYVGMGNNPVSGIDPDGQWVNFAIGAVIGGFSGWQIGKAQGARGWSMFGYIMSGAAIGIGTAGVGTSIAGATASWGTVGSGMASGAAAGFVGGGFNAALGGGNFMQGATKGALWGGLIGGAVGIGQAALQANKTIGDFSNDGNIPSDDPVEFSRSAFDDFLSTNKLDPNSVNARTYLPNEALPPGYKVDPLSKNFVNPDGGLVEGTLKRGSLWQNMFSNKTNMYISEGAFRNGKLLYVTVGHEFIHAYHASFGYNLWGNAKHNAYSERSAYDWTIMTAKSMKLGGEKFMNDLIAGYNHHYKLSGGGMLPFHFNWRLVPNIIKR